MSLWAGGYVGPHVGPLFKCSDSRAQGLALSRAPHQRRTDERVADRPGSHRVFGHIACVFAFWGARATLLHCWGIRCALCTRVPARRAGALPWYGVRQSERGGCQQCSTPTLTLGQEHTHKQASGPHMVNARAARLACLSSVCWAHKCAPVCVCVPLLSIRTVRHATQTVARTLWGTRCR